MKRLLFLGLIALLITVPAFAQDLAVTGSDLKTASGQVYTGRAWVTQFCAQPDGTNAMTATIYDGSSTSGRQIGPTLSIAAGSSTPMCQDWPHAVRVDKGIYLSLTGAGTNKAIVEYAPR